MSLNVSANSASTLPGFASSRELDTTNSGAQSESAQDKSAISLFSMDLQGLAGSEIDRNSSYASAADQLAELEALLSDYLAQQEALAQEHLSQEHRLKEGNEFPLSGSGLPAIAANIRELLDGLLTAKGLSQPSGEFPWAVTGQGGVALLANADQATSPTNAGQQLTAIADSLARLGEGAANTSEAARSLLGALSQTVKGLQQENGLSNSQFTHFLSNALNGKANRLDVSQNPLSTPGLTASVLTTERLSVDSQQLAMTELAVKDLSTTQGGLLAVTGNMRNGALQSAANANVNPTFNTQLELPLGNAQWGSQVLQRVAWLTGQGIAAAEIHLNPAELGPMQVRVDQRQDSATVVFTSHNSSTREAIEASLPRLRELFSQQGMELLDVDINSGEQEANANQQDAIDNLTSSQSDSTEALSTSALNEAAILASNTETVVLRYGLIDAYA